MGTDDKFIGTWIMDHGKSHGQALVQEQKIVIEEKDSSTHVAANAKLEDGTPIELKYSVPEDSTEGKIESGPYDRVIFERVDPNTRRVTYFRAGREALNLNATFAGQDEVTIERVARDAEGNKLVSVLHFHRQ